MLPDRCQDPECKRNGVRGEEIYTDDQVLLCRECWHRSMMHFGKPRKTAMTDSLEAIKTMKAENTQLHECLEAAAFYINASERELRDAGMTRVDALRRFHALHGRFWLAHARGDHG
jgi:hypothetical protein